MNVLCMDLWIGFLCIVLLNFNVIYIIYCEAIELRFPGTYLFGKMRCLQFGRDYVGIRKMIITYVSTDPQL